MHHSCWMNFRLKTLQSHSVSDAHMTAAAAEDPAQRSLPDARRVANEQERAPYTAALKTVYWIASEEVANAKYASLLNLQREQGLKDVIALRRGGNSIKESQVFNELLDAIDEVILHTFLPSKLLID